MRSELPPKAPAPTLEKATEGGISAALQKEGFDFLTADVENLLKGNQKGVRYGNMVLTRNESGTKRERFVKVMLDGERKTFKLFERQVKVSDALHKDAQYTFPTLEVVKQSLASPVPYAIFETREDGEGYGFMHDKPEFYAKFGEPEMQKLVDVMYGFQNAGANVDKGVLKLAREIPSTLEFYQREFDKLLKKRVKHRPRGGKDTTARVEELLAQYTGIANIRERIMQVLGDCFVQVEASQTRTQYLVHADMQIDNVYKHQNGDFELLDFEWVGKTNNPVVPIMYDYGNLRARAWSSPSFQHLLDETMLTEGLKNHPQKEEMLKAALTLGKLRSSLIIMRYHLDVANTVKKDKRTEDDYFKMFPASIASLVEALK